MSFVDQPMNQLTTLAQNVNQQQGGGDGVEGVTGALDTLSSTIIVIGGSIAGVAFLVSVVILFFKVKGGQGIGQAFSGLVLILGAAMLLGLGTVTIGWFMSIGDSLG